MFVSKLVNQKFIEIKNMTTKQDNIPGSENPNNWVKNKQGVWELKENIATLQQDLSELLKKLESEETGKFREISKKLKEASMEISEATLSKKALIALAAPLGIYFKGLNSINVAAHSWKEAEINNLKGRIARIMKKLEELKKE